MLIVETYKPGKAAKTFRIQIPITRPAKDININKMTFDLKSYVNIMQSEDTKQKIAARRLYLVYDLSDLDSDFVYMKNVVGAVSDWTLDYIEVEVDRGAYNRHIAPYIDKIPMKAGIVGSGELLEGTKDVLCLDKIYAFQLLYGISAQTLEKVVKKPADKKEVKEDDKAVSHD